MGFGDVKLVIPFGWILGFSSGVSITCLLLAWSNLWYRTSYFGNKT